MMLLLLALAGGLGAVARFLSDAFLARHNPLRMPVGTIAVNIAGSLLLGLIAGVTVSLAPGLQGEVRMILGTGFCGGYTTFSTASVEALRLMASGSPTRSAVYAVVTVGAAVPAAFGGLWLGQLIA